MVDAIPKVLQLGRSKPAASPAYTRKIESIATNAQTFTKNSVANIMIDTATPEFFLDPSQSQLQLDLTITNTNPYIDYIPPESRRCEAITRCESAA